jgi:cytochrome c2
MARPLRCMLGMHKWVVHQESGVESYHECARCHRMMENRPYLNGPLGQ